MFINPLYSLDTWFYKIYFVIGGDLSKTLFYKKPNARPVPSFEPPVTIDEIHPKKDESVLDAEATETVYNMLRSGTFFENANYTSIKHWGQFHAIVGSNKRPTQVSNIAFNPILLAPPNEPATVYTTLKRVKATAEELGQSHIPIFFDMGLLWKALEITWAYPQELSGVIPCEGGMHFLMSVFSGIGYIYADAGLSSLLHESEVFAAGSVQQMLSGKQFDRTVYAIKLVDEVLHSRFFLQFHNWCRINNRVIPESIKEGLQEFHK